MKLLPLPMILFFWSFAVFADTPSDQPQTSRNPPYKLNINLPAGFAADVDPSLMVNGRAYVFDRQNGDTGTMAVLQFITRPPMPKTSPAYRRITLNLAQGDLRATHENYSAAPMYELQSEQTSYTCTDWTGSAHGSDFAGFMCVASVKNWTILVEAQDLASNADKTLPQLKESLRAASYTTK